MCMNCQLFTGKFEKEDRELIKNIFAKSSVHFITTGLKSATFVDFCGHTILADVPSSSNPV